MAKDLIDDFSCARTVMPVVDWLKRGDEGKNCPPCLLHPLAEYYISTLEESGAKEQVVTLRKAWDSKDELTIAAAMDKIETEVGDDIRRNLIKLDCFGQSFEIEDE